MKCLVALPPHTAVATFRTTLMNRLRCFQLYNATVANASNQTLHWIIIRSSFSFGNLYYDAYLLETVGVLSYKAGSEDYLTEGIIA